MQEENEIFWLNEESQQMLNRGYTLKGETVMNAIDRICFAAAQYLVDTPFYDNAFDKFKRNIVNGWQSFSSPIWSNMGTTRGLPISCFNVHVPDTMAGITGKLSEVITQTKFGGGTSGYFGELRPRGASITDNGKSCGPVPFMQLFDVTMNVVSQGGVRRGSFAAYLDIDHPDIMEFLQIKDVGNPIQNLFTSVCVPDYWMNDMINGDSSKRKVWAAVLESRQQKGLPYIFFTDNVNRNKPQIYKDRNMQINASNLCFTGDTMVAVADGRNAVSIKQLAEESNGTIKFPVYSAAYITDSWSSEIKQAIAFKTGTKKVIEVVLSNGDSFKCTPDHQLALHSGGYINAEDSLNANLSGTLIQYKSITNKLNNQILTVIDIIDNNEIEDVYDLTVDDNHNFYIITSTDDASYNNCQGVLVHNCSEIALPSTADESFVCCLASMNLELYDEWKDTDAVFWATLFLDCVMTEFINKTEHMEFMGPAHNFAKRHRALGLGVMGFHSYLQKKMIPIESFDANMINAQMFKNISAKATAASIEIGNAMGFAPIFDEGDTTDTKRRNTTTMAIAPTTSSSSILGQASPGIEPYSSNYYKAGLAKGNFMRKNKYLAKLLADKGMDNEDVWRSIMLNHGSILHLDDSILNEHEKSVFKTFTEISQMQLIKLAAQRQTFIDQMQSVNLKIPSTLPVQDVNNLMITAWKDGVKSIYYQRSTSVSKELMTNMVLCNSCEA